MAHTFMTEFNFWRFGLDLGWLALLLLMFYRFWQSRQLLVDAQSWLKVKGHITSCQWVEEGHVIWPKIDYVYRVYDQDIVGHYLFLDTAHNNPNSKYSRRVAYNAALAFQEYREIDIYYNPNHPDQSALDVTIPIKLNVILILISFLIVVHLSIISVRLLGS